MNFAEAIRRLSTAIFLTIVVATGCSPAQTPKGFPLLCYTYEDNDALDIEWRIEIETQFGRDDTARIVNPRILCEPVKKFRQSERPRDPGKPPATLPLSCYLLVTDDADERVRLTDQFTPDEDGEHELHEYKVEGSWWFCDPVEAKFKDLRRVQGKGQYPEHLASYGLSGPSLDGAETIWALDQFGLHQLLIQRVDNMLEPAIKNGQGSRNSRPLKCYSVKNPATMDVVVSVVDQFGNYTISSLKTFKFCDLATKTPLADEDD